jgi:hypothetical protein
MQLFKSKWMMGALALAGAQTVGCGGAPGPQGQPAELGQVQAAINYPTGVMAATNDTFTQQLKDDIAAALKENQSVPVVHPELLPPHLVPDLKVTQNACKVWVSFYSEGAGLRNSLGYFVYPDGAPPSSVPLATRQSNIIFANSSAQNSGGTLVQGNRFQLGSGSTEASTTFSAGSRIGFYLIADGCNATTGCTASNLNYSKPTYYSVDALNPESTLAKKRHALIVEHEDANRMVLGFEDLNRDASGTDHDFNDVVFTINWEPESCIEGKPQIDPDASCQAVKTRNPTAPSGFYDLDPCGTKTPQKYYCDMDTVGANGVKGGWTVPGWQPASALTSLGIETRGIAAATTTNWSRSLACLSFNESMVFNRTYNQAFTETLRGADFKVTGVPYALGDPGRSFNQGSYGPSTASIMQGCVSYNYDGTLFNEWACVTDWMSGGTAKGHIADFALDTNCNPTPAYTLARPWAWANNSSCSYVGVDYIWGIGVR